MVAIQNFWWMICTNTIQLGLRGGDLKEGQIRQQLLTQCLCQCPGRVYNHLKISPQYYFQFQIFESGHLHIFAHPILSQI